MSAPKEKQLSDIKKIGIIAGGGELPRCLIDVCKKHGLEVFVIGFQGQTDTHTMDGCDHMWSRLGAAGSVIKTLKSKAIKDLVMIGHIRRPSLKELKPDLKTFSFFMKEALGAAGDDGLLKALKRFLEKEGFTLHGAQRFMPELLAPLGALTKQQPTKEHWADIKRGVAVLQALGTLDVGQAVVVQQGYILGIEGAEGTDALIERCSSLSRKGRPPILVKLCKPTQDQDLDLPTIGPDTIERLVSSGFAGLAVHSGKSFISNLELVTEKSKSGKMFVVGIDPNALEGGV